MGTRNGIDGYKDISGTLNGFLKFDDETGQIVDSSKDILSRFFNTVEDDGAGSYTVTPVNNEKILLFILLNNNASLGDVQNWIIVPALITSLSTGSGLKDAQKRDLNWVKAQGYTSLYQRTAFSDDIV